jgi:hypothetical protein
MLQQGDSSLVGGGSSPPTVTANAKRTITLPTSSASLSGTATANGGATLSSDSWTVVSKPTGSSPNITAGGTLASPTASVTNMTTAGTYIFQLSETDNNGATTSAQDTVVVNAAPANSCKAWYWDSTNINVAITNANFPTVAVCDTIHVDPCATQAGYRSVSIRLSPAVLWKYSTADSNKVNIIFKNASGAGTIKTNSSGNLFANSIDSSNNLLITGLKMYDHTDPLFSSIDATGYLHHIKFYKDTLQNIPGLWGSGVNTVTLPNFTGNHDTVNCIYDLEFVDTRFDTLGNTTNGGITAVWLGGLTQNEVVVKPFFDSCYFNYAPSPAGSGAACYIHCQQCYFFEAEHSEFKNLGVVATPQGHAASIFMQASSWNIHQNRWDGDFSNGVRSISQADVPGMRTLFTGWDATYDGVSRFWANILDTSRKYPMVESQKDTIAITSLPYASVVRSPRIWNNTMYRGGTGKGNSSYNVSVLDWYEVAYTVDTVELHNNTEIGPPTDTTTGNFCYSTYCYALFTHPNGTTAYYDSSGNQFSQLTVFSNSGLRDTTTFMPASPGILATSGNTVPSWLTADYAGNAYASSGPSVGAVQYEAGGSATPPNVSAGSNQSINLPTNSITLAGSASAVSPATSISTYVWTQVSGPNTATFSSTSIAGPTASGLIAGSYIFKLTVTDNNGNTNYATVTITVNAEVNPTVNAGSNQSITLPTSSVTLSGSASGNNGATIASTTWSQNSGPGTATIASASSLSTTASALIQGTYVFKLTAVDSNGNSNSSTVTVVVSPAGIKPNRLTLPYRKLIRM